MSQLIHKRLDSLESQLAHMADKLFIVRKIIDPGRPAAAIDRIECDGNTFARRDGEDGEAFVDRVEVELLSKWPTSRRVFPLPVIAYCDEQIQRRSA